MQIYQVEVCRWPCYEEKFAKEMVSYRVSANLFVILHRNTIVEILDNFYIFIYLELEYKYQEKWQDIKFSSKQV